MYKKFKVVLLISLSFLFSFILIRNNFKTKWSIIDDHEIVYFLGSDQKILLSEFPEVLSKTEVGKFGISQRFRPSYYILRVAETYVWNDNPHLWYIARYFILVFFLFTISYLISKYFGVIPSIIFSLYIMTGKYWSDIWTRLGPGEIYVTLGLSFYFMGLFITVENKTKSLLPWLFFFIGGLISIGSKENMVILAIPGLYILVYRIIHKKIDWKLILPFLHIMFSLFVFFGVYLAISKTGTDIYANEVSSLKIIQFVFYGFKKTVIDLKIIWLLLLGLFILIPKIYFHQKFNFIKFVINNRSITYLLVWQFLIYYTQFIFYSGVWPTNARYDFPGILAKQIFWLCSLYLLNRIISEGVKLKVKSFVLKIINISFFAYLLIIIFNRGFNDIISASKNNASVTASFTDSLNTLSSLCKEYPDYALIIKSRDPWDYEPIFSIERFIRYLGVSNLIYIDYEDTKITSRLGMEKGLSETLINASKNGMAIDNTIFKELDYKLVNKNCIIVLLSGTESNNECNQSININTN
ncbi:MAG: hypothetical protein US60_C0045G0004 [Microgenomates group bacterium GW2011_GWC1_37_8]|uniref:Glycosyltransferase RgtA/B/C/D-like domain-containing protein n=1 Tax=Candidatus Woesebacteria bacterium GW2011_GWB1_38_8 TaxID=1618570 RepID=A0A0G0PA58_9BACT|nr:MAG: hypothetical protein US60_C0045G0004 [Microgenomates group bacterium GW2011_GWC1_37_8]KKQ86176.1 MAG: hypothetical protein UT08_C0001G0042 [Candidatus Woesebacteria bacterium GW2011_GWB1_38_8]